MIPEELLDLIHCPLSLQEHLVDQWHQVVFVESSLCAVDRFPLSIPVRIKADVREPFGLNILVMLDQGEQCRVRSCCLPVSLERVQHSIRGDNPELALFHALQEELRARSGLIILRSEQISDPRVILSNTSGDVILIEQCRMFLE